MSLKWRLLIAFLATCAAVWVFLIGYGSGKHHADLWYAEHPSVLSAPMKSTAKSGDCVAGGLTGDVVFVPCPGSAPTGWKRVTSKYMTTPVWEVFDPHSGQLLATVTYYEENDLWECSDMRHPQQMVNGLGWWDSAEHAMAVCPDKLK